MFSNPPDIFRVFLVSVYYFLATFVQMALALYFATILSFSTRFSNLFRGILFFPYLINGVAIASCSSTCSSRAARSTSC